MVAALVLARAADAGAQGPTEPPRVELAVTGLMVGSIPLGSGDASLTRPDGSRLILFQTDADLRSAGAEVHLALNLTPSIAIEGTGGWARPSVETHIHGDSESADSVTATDRWDRVTVEASFAWTFARLGRLSWFVRGGGGWARELAGHAALVEDAAIGSAGIGMKYWWLERSTRHGRLGVRVEGRAVARSGGLSFGTRGPTLAPAVAAGLILGF